MAYLKITGIQSYRELDEWLGAKQDRVLGYHTVARRIAVFEPRLGMANTQSNKNAIAIRQWNTDIYVLDESNIATLDVGSWFTVTTKQRLNDLLPPQIAIYSEKGRWYLWDRHWGNHRVPFVNGMQINVETRAVYENRSDLKKIEAQDKENAAMKKKIAAYLKGLTDDLIKEIVTDAQERGTPGDCWFCSMFDEGRSDDHLAAHVEEKYYMASLFLNACRAAHRGNPAYCMMIPSLVRHDLGKFLRKRLLKGVAVA